jgi:hypothetical protein
VGDAGTRLDDGNDTHQKIRFGRGDYRPLHEMPSARAALHAALVRKRRRGRLMRATGWLFSTVFVLLLLLLAGVYVASVAGFGNEQLRLEAGRAISAMVGFDVRTDIGSTRLTLDKSRFLALEVRGVKAIRIDTGEPLLEAGYLRFGVRFNPLLDGQVRLGNASIADARLDLAALPESDGPGWASGLMDDRGLVEPDLVNKRLFEALHLAFNAVAVGDTRNVALSNVDVVIGRIEPVELKVERFEVDRPSIGNLDLEGVLSVDDRKATITGKARRDVAARRISNVELAIDVSELDAGTAVPKYAFQEGIGAIRFSISGAEGAGADRDRLDSRIAVDAFKVKLEHDREFSGSLVADASLVSGSGKLEINSGELRTGRSVFGFNGAIGPVPRGQGNDAYRFDFVSDGSTVAPLDSPEPALDIVARLAGEYDPELRKLAVNTLGVRTLAGELNAQAVVEFKDGISPGLLLTVDVPELPVAEVKQLWPFFAAPGARRWVLGNLFAGKVVASHLTIDVAPGRFGNGIPMTHEEAFGHFEVQGSRFDVAGRLPPVRDAMGSVEFRGTDVDIALASGTVYMSEGRTVAASNGTLALRDSHVNPLVGKLAIDVAGDAPAIVELASYEPISVSRFIDLAPEKVSGAVSGKVNADIPFQKEVKAADLAWNVALDFKQLALDKEFDGQKISAADGTLLVDPTRAEFKAKGRLNGIPADVSLLEPFGDSAGKRRTDVSLVLDDAARKTMFPGLDTVLAGTAKVKLEEAGEPGLRRITADLAQSVVKLPWIGWSKGAGVPAQATFDVRQNGDKVAITNFRLSGDSFAASGAIDISAGSLAAARFSSVRLNRGDDFAVDVARQRGGYAIKVNGKSFDARSAIKTFLGDSDDAGGDDTSVTLSATLGQLRGFGNEALSGVSLSYSGSGFEINGTTAGGSSVKATDEVADGRRSFRMQTRDAGAVLRFLDIYERMQGGSIEVALAGPRGGTLTGQVDARDFQIVNEPRLASMVSSRSSANDRSLNEAVNGQIDVSRVAFERAYAKVEKGPKHLRVSEGVLRGPTIGLSFQGLVNDADNNIDLTGTFMPAYGINRMFGDIPLFGALLGNGRDRALIGITFRLVGKFDAPQVRVNPISAIAPGIFRSIFEFR